MPLRRSNFRPGRVQPPRHVGRFVMVGQPKREGQAGLPRHLPEMRRDPGTPIEGVAASFEIADVMPSRHCPDPLSLEPGIGRMGMTSGLQVWAQSTQMAPRGFSVAENNNDYNDLR